VNKNANILHLTRNETQIPKHVTFSPPCIVYCDFEHFVKQLILMCKIIEYCIDVVTHFCDIIVILLPAIFLYVCVLYYIVFWLI